MKETSELRIDGEHFMQYGSVRSSKILKELNITGCQTINGGYYFSKLFEERKSTEVPYLYWVVIFGTENTPGMLYTLNYSSVDNTAEEATTLAFTKLQKYLNEKNNLHETDDSELS